MRRLLIINNIPTPYRTFMFQKFHDVGLTHGIETTVAFQAEREEHRVWKAEDFRLNVPHFYSSGLRFWSRQPRKFFTYPTINLDILRRSCSGQYDWILYGALNSMNGWLVSWLPAGRSIKIIWSESNLHSTRYMSGWARVLKSRVLAGCHALACPGERALEYIYAFRPQARGLPVLLLPNLVDSSVFERTVSELRGRRAAIRAELGIAPHEQLFLGMGRMVDYKGFGQVVEAAAHVPGDYKIIFLGDGERLAAWRARVDELNLSQRIRFDGQKSESEVARHLAAADWFLHPALEDPSPLVTIEAATAGLPVAVANQTGNAPETVVHNESGYRFDAVNIAEISQTLEKMVKMDEGTRRSFGARSAELARKNFSPDKVADRFFRELPTLSRTSGAPEAQSQA